MGCTASTSASSFSPMSRSTEMRDFFFAEYELGAKMGKGKAAQIRSAKHLKTGSDFVVKIQQLATHASLDSGKKISDPFIKNEFPLEALVWRRAGSHPNIVGLVGAYVHNGLSFFVMPKCDTDFLAHLDQGAGAVELNEQSLGQVFLQVLRAVAHIHSVGAVHRDIKPDMFLTHKGVVMMCDFGLASICNAQENLCGIFGTAPFMAPEIVNRERYGQKVDNWSVGVMAYVLLFGEFPYTPTELTIAAMKQTIGDGKPEPSFEPRELLRGLLRAPRASKAATLFVRALLNRDAKERPSAQDALQMAYIRDLERAPLQPLPCMRPMLAGAVKAGAFENPHVDSKDRLDVLLEQLQLKYFVGSVDILTHELL